MPWLNVPHIQQSETGWCLPACVAMVTAFWQQPLLQDDIARWLGATHVGVPAGRIQRLNQRGFDVIYRTGSFAEIKSWIERGVPCILFVRTGDLPYWSVDTPHAVVLAGLETEQGHLFDPAFDTAPMTVNIGDMILAWSHFDFTYCVLTRERTTL